MKPHILLLSKTGKAAAERELHGAEKGFWDDRIWHSKQPHQRPLGMVLRQIKELAIVILAEVTSVLSVEVILKDGPETIGNLLCKKKWI